MENKLQHGEKSKLIKDTLKLLLKIKTVNSYFFKLSDSFLVLFIIKN